MKKRIVVFPEKENLPLKVSSYLRKLTLNRKTPNIAKAVENDLAQIDAYEHQ
jgi:hypothetical protein